jgi:predicted CoA-binding protein
MSKLDSLVDEFLALNHIAVVGVSDQRDTGCNLAYRTFRANGYKVTAVNPRMTTFEGEPCYPDLKSIPDAPEGVFILTNPSVTDTLVEECVQLGIKHVWMHCMMGTKPGLVASMTSVSQDAVRMCHENGIAVIPGSCPNQYLGSDFGHKVMKVLWGALGFMKVQESTQ